MQHYHMWLVYHLTPGCQTSECCRCACSCLCCKVLLRLPARLTGGSMWSEPASGFQVRCHTTRCLACKPVLVNRILLLNAIHASSALQVGQGV